MGEKTFLIAGLGNPGEGYRSTRHNVGLEAVKGFAQKKGIRFKGAPDLVGDLAKLEAPDGQVLLLLPRTFMNSSGDAVRKCVDYYQVPLYQLLIVCDDVALPLGQIRMRAQGSSGGHNGLKSVEAQLRTKHYMRLRIGVGAPLEGDLSDYVLGKFPSEERPVIDSALESAIEILSVYVEQGSAAAMQKANARAEALRKITRGEL
ncbi:MAG: aminoacyl-tRNA hydrolase [Chlamydiales bacterium]|nr:aminoacyl-tRNA hydrolase [Chlamydiales bacterium]